MNNAQLSFVSTPGGLAPNFLLSGSVQDLKSSLNVEIIASLPPGSTIKSATIAIDLWRATTATKTVSMLGEFKKPIGSFLLQAEFSIGRTGEGEDFHYNYVNNNSYKTLFSITIADIDGDTTLYQYNYQFNYANPTPTLSDFGFDSNVQVGDDINITGLNVENPTADSPSYIEFSFDELELIAGRINSGVNPQFNPTLNYNSGGSYTLENNTLENDNFYQITALAYWATGYSIDVNSPQYLFLIARPKIANVIPYDVQDDGSNDGVNDPDGSTQIIASISLSPVGYVKYKPVEVKFIFYDSSDNEIASSIRPYNANATGLQDYDITLGSLVQKTPSVFLMNGIPGYKVKAEVKVTISISSIDPISQQPIVQQYIQYRQSDAESIIFQQGVAPILPLTIGNTWDLVSNGNPSSYPTLYNQAPTLGISGYFLKNAQFMSKYSRNLDSDKTEFLIQYKLNNGTFTNVVSAALIQQGSEDIKQTMINAKNSQSIQYSSNGRYANIVGPSGVMGPNQKPLVFYIPNVQGTGEDAVTFTENDRVVISVTVIDTTNKWFGSPSTVTNTSSAILSNSIFMVNQIPTYSYTPSDVGTAEEPYINNIDVDISNNRVSVLNNNVLSTVPETQVIADSSVNIITQTARGWTVVNTGPVVVGTTPTIPKVNLYYYNKSMSTPSFTMGQVNQNTDLGMWYVINQNQGAKQYPFLIAYTTPDPSANWYKSKVFYAPVDSGDNPIPDPMRSGFTLLYTGTDNGTLYPEIPDNRRVKLAVNANLSNPSTPNPNLSTEEVMTVSIQTSSNAAQTNAGDFNFTLLYAGVIRNGSYTTTLFTDPLLNVNIPINTTFSMFSDNTFFRNVDTPSGGFVITETDDSVSDFILPALERSTYNVQYSILDPNKNNTVVRGLISTNTTISTLNTPQLTDFTVYNFDYTTMNDNDTTSISFNLSFNPYVLDRIDGVNVYFNRNGLSDLVGTFETNQTNTSIDLSNYTWAIKTSATITFVPFRDNRVESELEKIENVSSTFTSRIIYNVPKLSAPTNITLTGGVINSSSNTVINWNNENEFNYELKITKNTDASQTITNINRNGTTASAILPIDTNNIASYTVTLKKLFAEDSSPIVTITFNTINVITSNMNVVVSDPSNLTSVTASWGAPTFSGPAGTSISNNIATIYLTDNGNRINTSVNAPSIETSGTKYLVSYPMGTTLQLRMNVTAYIQYTITYSPDNSSSFNSSPVGVPVSSSTPYTMSTVPSVSLSSTTSPVTTVLVQADPSTPSLLLDLNAKGLEAEGFISVVLVITQDGTDEKPAGCEVLLQFPPVPNSQYHSNNSSLGTNSFLFPNVVGGNGGTTGNANLASDEFSSTLPLNVSPTGLSNNSGSYKLTIGHADISGNSVGRYGLSTLKFPPNSGFESGQEANIMAILTTRRGTDIMVDKFTFISPPIARNVTITTDGVQYFCNFELVEP
jgi:hypothetical protein